MKETILAVKLKEYREKNKLTQSTLVELLEVSDKSISKWELGATYLAKKYDQNSRRIGYLIRSITFGRN
ncbi:helix-turn-helix transcriptional regulator [Enterococcus casseliflavus]|uniref:helix-turn-helix domain-containing protein n=1 Tax=Enterococcus entomosocium TaxID=3034352 RepID=UPI001E4E4634|nr:helix-turn-helix transcriptional regulator [Enterococcus casseliflavus]